MENNVLESLVEKISWPPPCKRKWQRILENFWLAEECGTKI